MEYTIEITQYCPNNCDYCSTDATPKGEHLALKTILDFLKKNNVGHCDRINISGGEPLAHPDFYLILKACQSRTKNVWVYTNALEQIKYNARVLNNGINVEANICLSSKCFDNPIKVNEGTKINLLKFVPKGRGENLKEISIHVSGNMRDKCPCEHVLLQADGQIAKAPCQKNYTKGE